MATLADAAALEQIAMRYVDGLMTADACLVPLHPEVRRAHLIVVPGAPLAWQIAQGADQVRDDFTHEALTVRRNMRINVDRERSSVVLIWESGMAADFAKAITIVDRFVIEGGLIREIEIISIPQGQPFGEVAYAGWDHMIESAEGSHAR
jgi:hypothetical protein